jgi:thioredoxin type arsenate reductase
LADPVRVLFLCTGNSARSQMAEALLSRIGGSGFQAFSAGTEPRGLNPDTVRVLAEAGIDWSGARSKPVTEYLGQSFDYVVTLCDSARQACPLFPGRHERLHWDIEDPAGAEGRDEHKLAAFRATRTEIERRVRAFVASAAPTTERPGG